MTAQRLNTFFGGVQRAPIVMPYGSTAEDMEVVPVAATGKYERQTRYQRENVYRLSVAFSRKYANDLLLHLSKQPSKAAYIRDLVRQDMEATGGGSAVG